MPTRRSNDHSRHSNSRIILKLLIKPGENGAENNVKGILEVESEEEDVLIHGILLTVHGEVSTEITSSNFNVRNGDHKYFSSIFVQSTYVFGKESGTTVLPQGKKSLPFTLCLPPHLPSSFEGTYGVIKYMLTAKIKSDNDRSDDVNKITHPLQVQRTLSLADGFAYGNSISFPSSLERPQKTLITTLAPNHMQLKYVFKIQKTGFATGEIIPFVLDIYNPERKNLTSMSVTLLKKTVYGDLKHTIDVFEELAEVSPLTIDNLKSTLTWIGSLHVPQLNIIPTHSVIAAAPKKKPIFSHKYLLRIQLLLSSGARISGDMPIVIGTAKYEGRFRRQTDHCCRTYSAVAREGNYTERQLPIRRQSSVPPSYSQAMFNPERRPSLETLPPPYEEVIAMASRAIAKETRHLMG